MSGRWMTAGDRFSGYRADVPGVRGDGRTGNLIARAVLRELCRVAHDSGVVQIGVVRLHTRIGSSDRAVRYALARLQSDGWVTRAVRGTGNKHNTQPRETVWVVHQLPDAQGELWPNTEWLQQAWQDYTVTPRYQRLELVNQRAVKMAWSGAVDNPLLAANQVPTSGKHLPHISQVGSQGSGVGTHPKAAAKRRSQLVAVRGES